MVFLISLDRKNYLRKIRWWIHIFGSYWNHLMYHDFMPFHCPTLVYQIMLIWKYYIIQISIQSKIKCKYIIAFGNDVCCTQHWFSYHFQFKSLKTNRHAQIQTPTIIFHVIDDEAGDDMIKQRKWIATCAPHTPHNFRSKHLCSFFKKKKEISLFTP